MVMMRYRLRGCNIERIYPIKHSENCVWEIIKGPDWLVGRVLKYQDINYGGWCNGEIHARNILNGKILIKLDSVEAVI
jgi:hypothetical protein